MIIVWGAITAREDAREEMISLSLEHVHRSRLEPGCITHSLQIDAENPNRLVFYEQWADMAALQAHFKVPASGEFVKAVNGLAADHSKMEMYDATLINNT